LVAFKRFVRSRVNSRKRAFIKVIYDLSHDVTQITGVRDFRDTKNRLISRISLPLSFSK
jgi:hypothetical protein